jgi:SRSO17 transposase
VETFVNETTYQGTCYLAANWLHLGHSKGFARVQREHFQHHGNAKKVLVYVVEPRFRQVLGCKQRYLPPKGGFTEDQIGRLVKLVSQMKFHEELEEKYRLGVLEELPLKLKEYAEGFRACIGRATQLGVMVTFWVGLASRLRRKNAEAIALETGVYAPRTMQDFLCSYKWDHGLMLEQHRVNVAKRLNAVGGAIALDPSDNPKKGVESVGVTRQYCGNVGKVDNCQSGVYASYVSENGYELVDGRLFIPEVWFTPEYKVRRVKCDMPSRLTFKNRVEIGLEMVERLDAENLFDFKWVLGDTLYGASPKFRAGIPEGRHYFLDAKKELHVKPLDDLWKGDQVGQLRTEPKPRSIADLARDEKLPWQMKQLGTGTKGPIVAKVALLHVEVANTGEKVWLFIRHDPDGREKYALSNAPLDTEMETFCKLSLMRWKIEQCFRECKDMLGMGDYENRTWDGWHRHMALVMTMHFFIQKWCLELDPENKGLTRHMSREIIAAALIQDQSTIQKAIKNVKYHLRRNEQAMNSHWKTTVRRAKKWANQLKLCLDFDERPPPLSAL